MPRSADLWACAYSRKVADPPIEGDSGQFWILSSTVNTVDEGTTGDAHLLAPDGTAVRVVWRTPGDYCFEESSFSGTHPRYRHNHLTQADAETHQSSLVSQTMPGIRAKWEAWRSSLPK